MKKKKTLKTIGLTNGEFGRLQEIYHFLAFFQKEGLAVPDIDDAASVDSAFVQYMKHVRLEELEYVSKLRVKRGEKPLPKRIKKRWS